MISISITGLDRLVGNFKSAPAFVKREIESALKDISAMMETESKRRTPVDTGLLRSSIAGAGGYSFLRGLTAGFGTNVKYALRVHEGYGKHNVGERLFMEKGAKAGIPYVERRMKEVVENVGKHITK